MFASCLFIYVWYVVSWHVLACLVSDNISSGALPCFCHVCSNISDRRYIAIFLSCLLKHFWQAVYWHALAGLIFENASGGPLPYLCPIYSNTSARWYIDMFWHVGCLKMVRSLTDMFVACFFKHLWQVLYWVADRTRQNHAKIQKKDGGFACFEMPVYVVDMTSIMSMLLF